jgi:hypothetical protein
MDSMAVDRDSIDDRDVSTREILPKKGLGPKKIGL